MKRLTTIITGSLLSLALAAGASAHEYKMGDVTIGHPWTRATLPNAPVAGGYLSITNNGSDPVTLTGGSTPVAETVEVHSMEMKDGVMSMRELPDGLTVKPGESVDLKPGGYHLMMKGLKKPVEKGEKLPMTLTFSGGRSIDVELAVEAVGANAPDGQAMKPGREVMQGMDASDDHRSHNDGDAESMSHSHGGVQTGDEAKKAN